MDQAHPEYLDGRPQLDDELDLTDATDERMALTEELLQIGRELADLPEDGKFGRKLDLRERQKDLRHRLAQVEDEVGLPDPDEARGLDDPMVEEDEWIDHEQDEELIDLERDDLVTTELPPERFRA